MRVRYSSHCSAEIILLLFCITGCRNVSPESTEATRKGRQPASLSPKASFIDTVPDLILAGESPGPQQFGVYIACGDVNEDGFEDLLIAAPGYDNYRGRVYLYCGGEKMEGNADITFTGEDIGDLFGMGVGTGDVNGDGFDDVIIGACGFKSSQGRVYIFFGGPYIGQKPDLVFEGEEGTQGAFGRVIDTADIDNDGCVDVVINANLYSARTGRAYLYYGGKPMDTFADKIFDGEHPDDRFGREMDMGPDVNGDGYGDIIFGCRAWNNGQGRAYLYYGGPNASMDENCDKIFTSPVSGRNNFGSSVCLFDIDDDDYADVIIGARYAYSQGRVYLYWGSPSMDLNADVIFEAGPDGGAFGGDNIACGYFNDDKYGDIAVSAWGYHNLQGRVYLFYGDTKTSMNMTFDRTFTGETGTTGNMFGVKVAVGDFNGDRYADLLVGAPYYTDKKEWGRAYVYYSKPLPSEVTIYSAAWFGNLKEVRSFIDQGADINREDQNKSAPLHYAVEGGHEKIAGLFVAKGADVNAKGWDILKTPLHCAAGRGHDGIVELLLDHGARINARDDYGATPLHYAAQQGHQDTVKLLINKNAEIDAEDSYHLTPAMAAMEYGRKDVAVLLISKGADPNARNWEGNTLLHIAAERDFKDFADLLLAKGADINALNKASETPVYLAMQQSHESVLKLFIEKAAGSSSIHLAAYEGNVARVKQLIEQGCDVNRDDASELTALHYAGAGGHLNVVRVLMAHGAEVNTGEWTPLHVAAQTAHRDVEEYLIANGADVNAGDDWTPLQEAARQHKEMVELLIAKGAEVNVGEWTALHVAVNAGQHDIVETLIANGADINAGEGKGSTPLHVAVRSRDMATLLIMNGASVNAKDDEGRTPLHSAAAHGTPFVVQLLISHGADINAKDNEGRTPLWHANSTGEVARLLRSNGARE